MGTYRINKNNFKPQKKAIRRIITNAKDYYENAVNNCLLDLNQN